MTSPWIRRIDHTGPGPDLLLLPYAGGGHGCWQDLIPHLAGFCLWQACLPGRDGRLAESPVTAAATVATALTDAWGPHPAPWLCYGHSMGALLAVLLIRERARRGWPPPVGLAVGAAGAPHRVHDLPDPDLDDDDFLDALQRRYGRPAGVDPTALRELLAMLCPTIKADIRLVADSRQSTPIPLPAPLLVCRGGDDPMVTADAADAWSAWRADAGFATLPGGHFFLHERPHELAVALRAFSDRVRGTA